ncbi:MAG: hypothetical protein ABSF90_11165, partial [Syntrophobacteraceae bacterium]|jgi:hypothetical protein
MREDRDEIPGVCRVPEKSEKFVHETPSAAMEGDATKGKTGSLYNRGTKTKIPSDLFRSGGIFIWGMRRRRPTLPRSLPAQYHRRRGA